MNVCRKIQRTSMITVMYHSCVICDSELDFNEVTTGKVGGDLLCNAHVEKCF